MPVRLGLEKLMGERQCAVEERFMTRELNESVEEARRVGRRR